MRTLAAALLILATIGWAIVAWAGLFALLLGLEGLDYTWVDGVVFSSVYLVAPLVLAIAWSLLLRRGLLASNRMKTAAKVALVLAGFVVFAWLIQTTVGA